MIKTINKILEKRFKYGKDYAEEKNSGQYYLTVRCFKKVCVLVDSDVSDKMLDYFVLMDLAYREWFGPTSYERRKVEDPEVTRRKTDIVDEEFDDLTN
jgi:hypothetical protein